MFTLLSFNADGEFPFRRFSKFSRARGDLVISVFTRKEKFMMIHRQYDLDICSSNRIFLMNCFVFLLFIVSNCAARIQFNTFN